MEDKKDEFRIKGFAGIEKEVKPHSKTAGKLYLPESWVGKKVFVVLKEAITKEKKNE